MHLLSGVLFHFIGGLASGSFYVPYKKVKGWAWESLWIVGGLFSWLIVPPIAAWLTIPDFIYIITEADVAILGYSYLFGLLWGIGGLTYGLGIRYLGVGLGSSIILGLTMVFGSLMPSFYYQLNPTEGKEAFEVFYTVRWGIITLIGLAICIAGIIFCGKAAVIKEKELGGGKDESISEFRFGLGITLAIVSGILSACFNFGIEAGKPMADVANQLWKANNIGQGEFLFQNNVTYILILWGGLTTNFIWCLFLNFKNKTFRDYTNKKSPLTKNYLLCALAGTTWYLQFFFYGMGESKMENGATSWILRMAFIILIANLWGYC
jgi:L-rhamnose-H+ transport protein